MSADREAGLLYAEYLPNIQSLNLTIQLSATTDHGTSIDFDETAQSVILRHCGHESRLRIPIEASTDLRLGDLLPQAPSTSKSSRLKPISSQLVWTTSADEAPNPWPAIDMSEDTVLKCGASTGPASTCGAVIVGRSIIKQFKDLPSEGWAEMMDLWHCHKPHEQDRSGANGTSKGYGAGSSLVLQRGTAFVDILSILIHPEDCSNTDIDGKDAATPVRCGTCRSQIGTFDTTTSGIRLLKPFLAAITSTQYLLKSLTMQQWLSCYLLALVESSGVRKFECRYNPVTIWIFSPLVVYATSTANLPPTSAMKVFFQPRANTDGITAPKLSSTSLHTDELNIPEILESALLDELQQSNNVLPASLQLFQDWRVGLLDRFTHMTAP